MKRAIVVAATASGIGKTSLCAGIAQSLVQRGMRVRCAKIGPDYLDPTILDAASGLPCINLDDWMMGPTRVEECFAEMMSDADFGLIEGVMGLYDGARTDIDEGSTAAFARRLGLPVILVVDASGCARSFAAMVEGFTQFTGAPNICAVVANRCGKRNHPEILRQSLLSMKYPIPLLGTVPKGAFPHMASRHLGLESANSNERTPSIISQLSKATQENLDLSTLLQFAKEIELLPCAPKAQTTNTCRVAIAFDDAFQFNYPGLVTGLENLGATVVKFSPLHDVSLPENVQGLILGGGYPELHAEALAANQGMKNSIREHAQRGGAIYAECGGLMYVSEGIQMGQSSYAMLGILPQWVKMEDSLQQLGYVQISLRKDCLLGKAGDALRGHEFHYSRLVGDVEGWLSVYSCSNSKGLHPRTEGFRKGKILASYVHIPWDAYPQVMESFLHHCRSN